MKRPVSILAVFFALATFVAAQGDRRLLDAAASGDIAAVRTLLRQRVDVNAKLADGNTALHLAAKRGDQAMVTALIAAGADVKAVNRYNVTPLVEAAANPTGPVTGLLLRAGASPNTVTIAGETVLMTAARLGNAEAARALIEAGADVNAVESTRDQTALMWAAGYGHPAVVKVLVERGATVSAHDRTVVPAARGGRGGGGGGGGGGRGGAPQPTGGMTALLYAARLGNVEVVRTLLDAGADVNETDAQGWNALIMAISNTFYDTAKLLVDRGASVNLREPGGRTALYTAVDMHTIKPGSGRPIRPEFDAMTSVELAEYLLARGADPNAKLNAGGTTALLRAAQDADISMMEILLKHGAEARIALDNGNNAVMLIAAGAPGGLGVIAPTLTESQLTRAIQLCLDGGVDINAANGMGETALHAAARVGSDTVVKILVDKGARMDVRNMGGFTPLDLAEGKGAPPGRGGAATPPVVRESTVALLKKLMEPAAAQ